MYASTPTSFNLFVKNNVFEDDATCSMSLVVLGIITG